MEISTQDYKHCSVVSVTGRFEPNNRDEFTAALSKLVESGRFNIILDFAGVVFMSGNELAIMISLRKAVRTVDGGVVLAHPSTQVRNLLEMSGLEKLFMVFDTWEEAANFFRRDNKPAPSEPSQKVVEIWEEAAHSFRRHVKPAPSEPSQPEKFIRMGAGFAIGISIGLGIGRAFDIPAIGILIGIAIGVAIGAWFEHRSEVKGESD